MHDGTTHKHPEIFTRIHRSFFFWVPNKYVLLEPQAHSGTYKCVPDTKIHPGVLTQRHKHPLHTPTAATARSLQSCPTLWDPIDGSPPGSPVPGILQARTLEWVAISFFNA